MRATTEPLPNRGSTPASIETVRPEGPVSGPVASEPSLACLSVARVASSLLDVPVAFVCTSDTDTRTLHGIDHDRYGVQRFLPPVAHTPERSPFESIGGVVSHLEFPVREANGRLVASLCVADRRQRLWTDTDQMWLAELAGLLAHQPAHLAPATRPRPNDLSRQLSEAIAGMTDSVSSLVDLAEQQDDPKLHRFAATSRKRMDSVLSSAESLSSTAGTDAEAGQDVRYFDLRQAVNRALREVTFVSGRAGIESDLGAIPLRVAGDQFGAERAITHSITAILHNSAAECCRIVLRPTPFTGSPSERTGAVLTVAAKDCPLSAAEVARIISRFESADGAEPESAQSAIRFIGGEIVASSDAVRVRSGRTGTTISAYWPIDCD